MYSDGYTPAQEARVLRYIGTETLNIKLRKRTEAKTLLRNTDKIILNYLTMEAIKKPCKNTRKCGKLFSVKNIKLQILSTPFSQLCVIYFPSQKIY